MKTLKRIGSIAAGAVMLGAAMSGAVSAGMDATGLTKDFFYDAGYNPVVQVVVGSKGLASDSVAAGNIAAVIGNLAYTSAAGEGGATASGKVVLGVAARGATGKYEQASPIVYPSGAGHIEIDNSSNNKADFYQDNEGLIFKDATTTYTKGSFVTYSIACDQQTRSEAAILKEATYNNVHCLFCQTLCLSQLENPSHDFEEKITVNYNKVKYYEDGLGEDDAEALALKVESGALQYVLLTGDVPMTTIDGGSASDDQIDFEWRGKFLLFGEEYYTKDVDGLKKIYLAKGKILDDISSEGYTAEYNNYKFKIDHLIYSAEYTVAGILLDVEKPDGTVVQTQISKMANGIVDDIEISGVYAEEADAVATASILVYDTTTNVLLEDGKDMSLGGETKKYWRVQMSKGQANASTDVTNYQTATSGTVLQNITVTYRHSVQINEGQSLDFPSTFKLMFNGFRTSDFGVSPCSGAGSGNIKIYRDGKYRVYMDFTGDDGNAYTGIALDQGPFARGDNLMLNGKVYLYDDANEQTDDTTMRLTLKNVIDGGKTTVDLLAANTADGIRHYIYTYSFESWMDNDQYISIEPDPEVNASSVYIGQAPSGLGSVTLLYDSTDLYVLAAAAYTSAGNLSAVNGSWIGLLDAQYTTAFEDFDNTNNKMYLSVVLENQSAKQTSFGTFSGDKNRDADNDDLLIRLKNSATNPEYVVIDFYDRKFNTSKDTYYTEGVKAGGNDLPWTTDTVASDYSIKLQNEQDTLIILPEGGDRATLTYGSARSLSSVEVCHPKDSVYVTLFLGTDESTTTVDAEITKEDEGLTKTVGCCEYLVKEFGVTTTETPSMSVSVNPIVGNLVVSEIAADTTKNLVVVGGPSVNGMSSVTADEIGAATGKYIVKKDGNKVIVAGWESAETIDAGNALIAWLQANAHA
jgi:hypothetical protein